MKQKEFHALTGQWPIDVFGRDWQNIIEAWGPEEERTLKRKLYLLSLREKAIKKS